MTELSRRIAEMAELQEGHNRQVHPQWAEQGYAYYRAVWVECAELLDHFGWKWWKLQTADLDQVRLEIVDIWHFGLSELLRQGRIAGGRVDADIVASFASGLMLAGGDLRDAVERLALESLRERDFSIDAFVAVMRALPMTFDELYRHYVGKNVLNQFRQAHGYKTGAYRKVWAGREDNAHLVEISAALPVDAPRYADALFAALEERYAASAAS